MTGTKGEKQGRKEKTRGESERDARAIWREQLYMREDGRCSAENS
jgi:hypothetical protein